MPKAPEAMKMNGAEFSTTRSTSFTDRDITPHFYILNLLTDGSSLTAGEIVEEISDTDLSRFNGIEYCPKDSYINVWRKQT